MWVSPEIPFEEHRGEQHHDRRRDQPGVAEQPVPDVLQEPPGPVRRHRQQDERDGERQQRHDREEHPLDDVLGVSGLVSEMSFIAIGMKPPGFASAAPAPTIAIHGDEATLLTWSAMLWAASGRAADAGTAR